MAQKPIPTALKDASGRRMVRYRDTDGKSYNALITNRDSATQADLQVRMGATKRTVLNVPQATAPKQTNVYFFV